MLPAIDVTRSVSRIGGAAQHPALRKEAGRMKLDFLQFLELEVFTRFGTKLEASLERRIHRGRLLRELLKQEKLVPVSPEQELGWLVGFNENLFDPIPSDKVRSAQEALFVRISQSGLTLEEPRERWLTLAKEVLSPLAPSAPGPSERQPASAAA
ncbi:MAG: hypothetical protein PHP75_04150 [Methylacidiphilaceae bacterium]|nr:hypothetical protein [Candidatus Methylacidiphilaceae bacterium]